MQEQMQYIPIQHWIDTIKTDNTRKIDLFPISKPSWKQKIQEIFQSMKKGTVLGADRINV